MEPKMGLGKFFARKGSIGSTARWVGGIFNSFHNGKPDDFDKPKLDIFVKHALKRRFKTEDHPLALSIYDTFETLGASGLASFTVAILIEEAEFAQNTSDNQSMFWEVIEEELAKLGLDNYSYV